MCFAAVKTGHTPKTAGIGSLFMELINMDKEGCVLFSTELNELESFYVKTLSTQ